MAVRRKPSVEGPLPIRSQSPKSSPAAERDPLDNFLWNVVSISNHFEDISFAWAHMLGVNVHQWMILMAIKDTDSGGGVSVKGVSAKLHADSSFVTAQSKELEKLGFLKRTPSPEDGRVVLMSLTSKAVKEIADLHAMREPVRQSILLDLSDKEVAQLNKLLNILRERFERAAKRMTAEL